jgi:hypothetical protein
MGRQQQNSRQMGKAQHPEAMICDDKMSLNDSENEIPFEAKGIIQRLVYST